MSAIEDIQKKAVLEMDEIELCINEAYNQIPNGEDAIVAAEKYAALQERVKELEEEVRIDNALLLERQKLLDLIPECPAHGSGCVPHAIEWIHQNRGSE